MSSDPAFCFGDRSIRRLQRDEPKYYRLSPNEDGKRTARDMESIDPDVQVSGAICSRNVGAFIRPVSMVRDVDPCGQVIREERAVLSAIRASRRIFRIDFLCPSKQLNVNVVTPWNEIVRAKC